MSTATIVALEAAVAAGALDTWLALIPTEAQRSELRRAIELDHRLWAEHPASLASCLLARTFDIRQLDAQRQAWRDELDARGEPWIRPLRALPIADGLLAELHADSHLDLRSLCRPRFLSDDEVVLTAFRLHPSVQAPELRRRDRARWDWPRGVARLERDPDADGPDPREGYPQIVVDGGGPAYLVRAPGAARLKLPCPREGSAHGSFSSDGTRLFVYGTHDEYAGGFVYIVDPATLAVKRQIETAAPVSAVHDCTRDDLLLIAMYHRGLALWSGGQLRVLPIAADRASLSPGGRHVATVGHGVRIWDIADLGSGMSPPRFGFPTCFDPSGERLLSGLRLSEGRSGERIADLNPEFGDYLEGGPASPWFHFGERHLISMHGGLRVWNTRSGAVLRSEGPLHFPQWYTLAYDRAGSRVAALRRGRREVAIYALPEARLLVTLPFEIAGETLALSGDAELIAVRCGPAIELRAASGALLRRFAHPMDAAAARPSRRHDDTLRFSMDGQRIASFCEGDGWRIWALGGEPVEHGAARTAIDSLPDFAAPRPRDWDIDDASTRTVFLHRPSGTRIALPAHGPWACNPAEPQYLACDDAHIELRADREARRR